MTKAWFNKLDESQVPEKISFAFLDGDYYHSILDPLKLIWSKLERGAIMIMETILCRVRLRLLTSGATDIMSPKKLNLLWRFYINRKFLKTIALKFKMGYYINISA